MSSFTRRTIRTTAAAAGVAALGIGIAGPALAAPSVPDLPGVDAVSAPAAPDVAAPDVAAPDFGTLGDTASTLPGSFQMPTVSNMSIPASLPNMSAPDASSLSAPDASAPDTSGIVTTDGGLGQFQGGPALDPQTYLSNHAAALPSLDTVKMMTSFSQLTANNDLPS